MSKISFLIATDDHPPDLDRFFRRPDQPDAAADRLRGGDHRHQPGGHGHAEACERARARGRMRACACISRPSTRAAAPKRSIAVSSCAWRPSFCSLRTTAWPRRRQRRLTCAFTRRTRAWHQVGVGSMILAGGPAHAFHEPGWSAAASCSGVPFSDDMTSVPEKFFYAGNCSVKREFLRAAGPLDEDFRYHAWDDYELGLRLSKLGMKASFLPAGESRARSRHFAGGTLPDHDEGRQIRECVREEESRRPSILARQVPGAAMALSPRWPHVPAALRDPTARTASSFPITGRASTHRSWQATGVVAGEAAPRSEIFARMPEAGAAVRAAE